MRKVYIRFILAGLILLTASGYIHGYAAVNSLQGKIIDGTTKKPVGFAIVIVQEAGLVVNAPQGNYLIELPRSGTFTVKVQSPGLESIITKVTVEGNVTRNFILNPFTTKGEGVVIQGEKDMQKISYHSMNKKEIKEVPASFGDSLNALTSLPSVSRPGGIFGPLVIRGADPAVNGYFIDDIPLYNPMHFGGFHSVINNDLIREIDLYSSSYPSQYSNAQAAIISINTIDDVKEYGGFVDVGLISACALYKVPITQDTYVDDKKKTENKGYIIVSGRFGYLTLFIPLFYEYVMNNKLDMLFQYWDYQVKAKYFLNSSNSLTFLAFGSKDDIKLIYKKKYMEEGEDPYLQDATWQQNQQSHNAGIYYTFSPKKSFSNTILAYIATTDYYTWMELPEATASWAHDIEIKSRPYIMGVKDKLKFEWWEKHGELRAGLEANYYWFRTDGVTILPKEYSVSFDPGDPDSFILVPLGETVKNKTLVHYLENKFTLGYLTFVPGYHVEYLDRIHKAVFDPRGAITLALPTGTTIGAAGGYYSCFIQTNGTYFNDYPNVAAADYLDPQRAIHRTLSLEQKVSGYTFKAEGFYNNFWDIAYAEENGDKYFASGSELKTYGFEIMAKINDESDQGLFGWTSYTWNHSKTKTYMDTDLYGDEWINSYYDMTHVIKAVAGYTHGSQTFSARFQYNTATPYTPITGYEEDTAYTGTGKRYTPVYGKTHTARLAPEHRLDLRYSYKTNYKWGYVSWYVEMINVYNYVGEEYFFNYSTGKATVRKTDGLGFLPNFGVEAKF